VNNVANAFRETGPAHVDGNIYLVVMEMPAFTEEALIVAYTFLLDNKAQGTGFVNMSDAHRTLWLRTFLAKNYYGEFLYVVLLHRRGLNVERYICAPPPSTTLCSFDYRWVLLLLTFCAV
jgi:hypothetical protein